MTIQEFDITSFGNTDRVKYMGEYYWVRKVDFEERLFGLIMDKEHPDDITWVRCENAILQRPMQPLKH